jgi:RNA polymerase sigma-B factor
MSATFAEKRGRGHEEELWRRLKRDRDQRAREELVNLYMPIARRMAGRYAGVAEPYDDLVQVASLGLLNAVDRFDVDRGTPFVGFAKPTIMGELKRHFRDKVWTIRVPRSLHDRIGAIETATEELTKQLGSPPSPSRVAEGLRIEVSDVLEALEARENRRPLGLDQPIHGEDGDGSPEWIGAVDAGYALIENRLTVERVLPDLDDRERELLRLRFVEELPQSEIAARIGCSQMQVSRLLRGSLERLREASEAADESSGGRLTCWFPRKTRRPGTHLEIRHPETMKVCKSFFAGSDRRSSGEALACSRASWAAVIASVGIALHEPSDQQGQK